MTVNASIFFQDPSNADDPQGVPFTHEEYNVFRPIWSKCRICFFGEEAVKSQGPNLLPILPGQTEQHYKSYLSNARYYNTFAKTVKGYTGLVMRNKVQIDAPDHVIKQMKGIHLRSNINQLDASIQSYVKDTLIQLLIIGRCGTLVDWNTETNRPYWISYNAEDILDWEFSFGNLEYVVIREKISRRSDHYFNYKSRYRYRVLELRDGVYVSSVYHKYVEPNDERNELISESIPTRHGSPLDFIPFVIHQTDTDIQVDKPPFLDLVDMSLSHYTLKADHRHALHYVAMPTPYVTGINPEDKNAPSTIGPHKLWLIANDLAKVGMLEYTGQGVKSILEELESLEDQMSVIGARMLNPDQGVEKTATSAKIKSIGETADLSTIVMMMNKQFNDIFKYTVNWVSELSFEEEEDVSLYISSDFIPMGIDSQMIMSMVLAWQKGAYDYETLVRNFQRGEIIDGTLTAKQMEKKVDSERKRVNEIVKEYSVAESSKPIQPPSTSPNQPTGEGSGNPEKVNKIENRQAKDGPTATPKIP